MRRKLQLVLLLVLIAGTTETGMRASTDCERWIASYKTQLAQARAVRKLQAAKNRVKRLAQSKLANYVKKPAGPRPLRVHSVRPKYTRQQMIDRFNLLCGDLPGMGRVADKLMEGRMTPVEFASEITPYVPVELSSMTEGGLIPPEDVPTYAPPESSGPVGLIAGGGLPGFPGMPSGPGPGGQNPQVPGTVFTPVIPTAPITPVPEPGSLILMLTGIAGAAGAIRQRMRA